MQPKVGELIQRLKNTYAGGVPSDDTTLSSRHAYSTLLSARALLIERRLSSNRILSNWMIQILPCVELILASPSECPCVPRDCVILRSKYKIPRPLSTLMGHKIDFVTSVDGNIKFGETSFQTMKYSAGNKYTANKPNYYFQNGYLYVTHRKALKVVIVGGVFEDPKEVNDFPSICGDCIDCNSCLNMNELDFPIENSLVDAMFDIAKKELLGELKRIPNDKVNDTEDNK